MVKRRSFLISTVLVASTGLAGCSGSEDETEDIQDSDGDGVIDSEDYAPQNPEVQEKSISRLRAQHNPRQQHQHKQRSQRQHPHRRQLQRRHLQQLQRQHRRRLPLMRRNKKHYRHIRQVTMISIVLRIMDPLPVITLIRGLIKQQKRTFERRSRPHETRLHISMKQQPSPVKSVTTRRDRSQMKRLSTSQNTGSHGQKKGSKPLKRHKMAEQMTLRNILQRQPDLLRSRNMQKLR